MNTEKVIKRDQKYIMHTYARSPLVLEHGEGMYAYDADGKAYLDFTSGIGVNALGYCHPAWVQAVTMQATRLQHSSNLYYTAPCGKLAKRLCARTGLDQVFFGNSGAEANEGAIKCARKYSVTTYGPDRNKVLTLVNSFHGRTLATLTATGQDVFHKDFGPFPANFGYIPANDFDTFKAAVDDSVCAVMMEMVQGEGGVVALDTDYVQSVADYCHAHDILIIVDEVQTGVGRTGTFLACEQFGLKPDLVTLAKGWAAACPSVPCWQAKRLPIPWVPALTVPPLAATRSSVQAAALCWTPWMMHSCATSTPAPPSCGRVLPLCRMSHLSAAWA